MNLGRRQLLKLLAAAGVATTTTAARAAVRTGKQGNFDVVVVGAGVFGIWSAWHLHRAGRRVAVIDAVAPAHSRASSGGESRVTRAGYGDKEIYSEWAWQSLTDWQALSARAGLPVFHPMGVLWLHEDSDALVRASADVLSRLGIPHEFLSAADLRRRYPVIRTNDGEAGFLEPRAGALMARRAVQFMAAELAADGVTFFGARVNPVHADEAQGGSLPAVTTLAGETIIADQFVFACGPWLDQVCPDAMAGRLFVSRQEVFYFAVPAGATGPLPVWADLPFYGFPDLEGRGFKVADDTHGEPMDPDSGDRRASVEGEGRARAFLARRFPDIAGAPLSESRVCQYENTSDGHLVIDRHPGLDNVWIAGGGSGHGFKHGPAVGAHVAALAAGKASPRAPFLLGENGGRQQRAVQ